MAYETIMNPGRGAAAATGGRVISVAGPKATVMLPSTEGVSAAMRATVGRFLGIKVDRSLQVGVVTRVSLEKDPSGAGDVIAAAQLDLIGEIRDHGMPAAQFRRGLSDYPAIGDMVSPVTGVELKLIYNASAAGMIEVGNLAYGEHIPAFVDVDEMLSKHFAVLGSTGVGKSSGVAHLVDRVAAARPDLRVLVLDVHNEYGRCFGSRAQVLNPANMRLPFWLFNFEEIVDVFFGGRVPVDEEVDLLAEVIPQAKASYAQYVGGIDRMLARDGDPGQVRYTADMPVPYRIVDLIALLDARMGKLENRSSRLVYHKLISRIETACNDPRYAFMFENANVGGDTMEEVLSRLFRLPIDGVPISVLQLAGFPSEVVDALVSVICRMAFDLGLWNEGRDPLLVVCEEAHRYISADRSAGFGPTRRAVARIAKEGRKYNVFLGLVTQRPAELDVTILSQCSTLFAMRLINERDQELLRASVSDAAANLLALLPSLGTGEVFAFGEGVALPTRFTFRQLPAHLVPRSETSGPNGLEADPSQQDKSLGGVIQRWRGVNRPRPSEGVRPLAPKDAPSLQPARTLDPDRYKLLKRPLDPATTPK
jgi:DNA helicase HerA-like ATPase